MTTAMVFHMELFGPRKGQTFKIKNHQFIDGHYDLIAHPENMGFALKMLSYYGAFAKGTSEYDTAKAAEVEANGADEIHSSPGGGETTAIQGGVRQDGAEPSEETTGDSEQPVDGEAGDAGLSADRDGHEDSGLPKFEEAEDVRKPTEPKVGLNAEILSAMLALDPHQAEHWVITGKHAGKPKLGAIEEIYGQAGLTRSDLDAVAPNLTRETALAEHARQEAIDI